MIGYAILSSLMVSLISLVGILLYRSDIRVVHFLMSFAAGSMLAASFLHLLPESMEVIDYGSASSMLIAGIISMFFLEKVINWHHCHDNKCVKTMGKMVLIGDSLHNFLDGIAIYTAFNLSMETGIAVTISIILHEIPQELGDFGILIHSGFTARKALIYNLISALTAVAGVVFASFLSSISGMLAAFSAGSLIYIAMADIIPEMHKERKEWLIYHLTGIVMGIILIYLL